MATALARRGAAALARWRGMCSSSASALSSEELMRMERDCSAHKYVRVRSPRLSQLSLFVPIPFTLLARPPRARRNASVPPASAPDAFMLGSHSACSALGSFLFFLC